MQLEQRAHDGFFYNKDGSLVAFDTSLTDIHPHGLAIRQDLRINYLSENNLCLFWSCTGEKQYILSHNSQAWSNWSGLYHMEKDNIVGEMKMEQGKVSSHES